ncbi:hypothetical protein BJX64DRAFT_282816 [Aspergillus heterothallicus]
MSSPSTDDISEDDSLAFDATLCATLYNRLVHIGFEGSKLAQHGEKMVKNWFDVYSNDLRITQCQELIPEPLASFLSQADIVVDKDSRLSTTHTLIHHLQPLPAPEMLLWYLNMSDWEEMHEYIVILPDNNTDKDCDGVLMYLSDLSVCYLPNSYDFNPGIPDEYLAWIPFQEPPPEAEAEYNSLLDDTRTWEIVPWNAFISNPHTMTRSFSSP